APGEQGGAVLEFAAVVALAATKATPAAYSSTAPPCSPGARARGRGARGKGVPLMGPAPWVGVYGGSCLQLRPGAQGRTSPTPAGCGQPARPHRRPAAERDGSAHPSRARRHVDVVHVSLGVVRSGAVGPPHLVGEGPHRVDVDVPDRAVVDEALDPELRGV